VPDQVTDVLELLRTRLFTNREAVIFAAIVFVQILLTIVNVVVLLQVARMLGVMKRTLAEAQFRSHELHDEIMRSITQDRELVARMSEKIDTLAEERGKKTDERRKIIRNLVDGFEATLNAKV
jgi:hypothetical protein